MRRRKIEVCPKCNERRAIKRGKTSATKKQYCSCPSCGHLWDPEKGDAGGETRKAEKAKGQGAGEGTLAAAVDWALAGDVRGYGTGRTSKLWVRVLSADEFGVGDYTGSGSSYHEALIAAHEAFLTTKSPATMD